MAKSAVIDESGAPETAPSEMPPLAAGGASAAAAVAAVTGNQAAAAYAPDAAPSSSGDSDAPSAGMTSKPQTGVEQPTAASSLAKDAANPAPMSPDQLERAKTLAKLNILDWARQQMREDPAGVALRMPYLQTRLKAWEDAKASGDADHMTKAYNDLLRGLEAEQNRRGIPKDEQRVLPNDMAEDVARGILNAEPAKMLDKLRAAKADHGEYADGMLKQIASFMPEVLKVADAQSSRLAGELVWRRAIAASDPSVLLPNIVDTPARDPAATHRPEVEGDAAAKILPLELYRDPALRPHLLAASAARQPKVPAAPAKPGCIADAKMVTCTPPSGGPFLPFSFPRPDDWPDSMADGDWDYHDYRFMTVDSFIPPKGAEKAYEDRLFDELLNDPTPGANDKATPEGQLNDVGPIGPVSWLGHWFGGSPNHVRSYVIVVKGRRFVVNVTTGDHAVSPGYVIRTVVRLSNGRFAIVTFGAGADWKQAFLPGAESAAKDVWDQNARNIFARAHRPQS